MRMKLVAYGDTNDLRFMELFNSLSPYGAALSGLSTTEPAPIKPTPNHEPAPSVIIKKEVAAAPPKTAPAIVKKRSLCGPFRTPLTLNPYPDIEPYKSRTGNWFYGAMAEQHRRTKLFPTEKQKVFQSKEFMTSIRKDKRIDPERVVTKPQQPQVVRAKTRFHNKNGRSLKQEILATMESGIRNYEQIIAHLVAMGYAEISVTTTMSSMKCAGQLAFTKPGETATA